MDYWHFLAVVAVAVAVAAVVVDEIHFQDLGWEMNLRTFERYLCDLCTKNKIRAEKLAPCRLIDEGVYS